jgi:hypothetical protein
MGELIESEDRAPGLPTTNTTPAGLLQIAVERGADIEQLTRLMDLQERWEANEARKAFSAAMSAFRAKVPVIQKDKHVHFEARNGGSKTDYWHATLAQITRTINPILAECGLTFSWSTEQDGGQITVHCDVTHVAGHTVRTTLTAGLETSGNKNPIQQMGSTVSYLQRYTLNAALGLSTDEEDDDGRRSGGDEPAIVTTAQAAELKALLQETNSDVPSFLKAYGGAPCVDELDARAYAPALKRLNAKLAQQRGVTNATR